MRKLFVWCLLAFLMVGAGNGMAQSNEQGWVVVELGGLYYQINFSEKRALLADGSIGKYYIEHNGDMSHYDSNALYEIPDAYKGSVTVPATVNYQGVSYPVTYISFSAKNPEITSLRVEGAVENLYISNTENLASLELVNPSVLRSMGINNTGLISLTIPAAVTSFSAHGNTKLAHLELDSGNTTFTLINGVLCRDNYLQYVPEGMVGVLNIPEQVIYSNSSLFEYCIKLTEIVIPSTYPSYNMSNLFYRFNKNIKVTFTGENPSAKYLEGGFIVSNEGNLICAFGSDTEELTIPEGIKQLGWINPELFPNLKILNLPASLEQTSFYELHYFQTLQQLNVAVGNKILCSVDGVIMDPAKETLLCVPNDYRGKTMIPAGTKTIAENAFQNNIVLTELTIPSSVTVIRSGAFLNCYNLTDVTIPASVEKIGDYIFQNCKKLVTVNLPQSLKMLGNSMFSDCYSLKTLQLPDVTVISNSCFGNCTNLESINIPASVYTIGNYAFLGCPKLKEIKLPAGLQTIGDYAFQGDSTLTSLTIPASVTTLGIAITRNCPLIEKITVEAGNYTFCDVDGVVFSKDKETLVYFPCSRGGSYTVPKGTSIIGINAFYECDLLKQIYVSEGVEKLMDGAIRNSPSLEVIDLPTTCNQITNNSLSTLSGLKKLILRTSGNLSSISYYLFRQLNSSENCVIFVHEKNFDYFKSNLSNSDGEKICLVSLSNPFGYGQFKAYLKGFSFRVVENDVVDMEKELVNVSIGDVTALKQSDGSYFASGLKTNTKYDLFLTYKIKGEIQTIKHANLYTKNFSCRTRYESTQSTITLTTCELRNFTDDTATPQKKTVVIQDKEYDLSQPMNLPLVFTGLSAGSSIPVKMTVEYQDGEVATSSTSMTTKGFEAQLKDYKVTPTTLRLNYTYKEIDAVPDSILLVIENRIPTTYSYRTVYDTLRTSTRDNLFTGLTPGKEYTVSGVFLKTKADKTVNYNNSISNYYNIISNFTTPALTILTETPKVPQRGRAIVSAKTNAGDGEGHVGFQWIKYNAPSTMNPYEAYGQVFAGTAQGQLKNLSATFYKLRAFYDTSSGQRIYATNGNDNGWITFDADEMSTFEAIVHTYADVSPTNTTVQLTGMMIEGSDAVISQGFEYWEVGAGAEQTITRAPRRVNAHRAMIVQDDNHQRIYIGGDNLTAELTGLIPGTNYAFRAFAETANGIVYGEECTFKTNGERPTAIEEIVQDKVESTTFHIYSLSGSLVRPHATSLEGLPRGLYIVNKRKVFVK